jgi:hypothetical protein
MHLAENRPENIECARLLLHYGADVNATDVNGCPALWYIVQRAPSSECVSFVQMLLDEKADVEFVKQRAPKRVRAYPAIRQRRSHID